MSVSYVLVAFCRFPLVHCCLTTSANAESVTSYIFPAWFHQTVSEVQHDFRRRHCALHHVSSYKLHAAQNSGDDPAAYAQHQRTRESAIEKKIERQQPGIELSDPRSGGEECEERAGDADAERDRKPGPTHANPCVYRDHQPSREPNEQRILCDPAVGRGTYVRELR